VKIYVDLDGVLADFDSSAEALLGTDNIYKFEFVWGPEKFWEILNEDDTFFRWLDKKDDADELWSAISHLDPTILTALPRTRFYLVASQKLDWVADNYPGTPVITCPTKDKPNYCEPGDIMIDDRAVNRDAWIAKGGIYIVHTTAARTIGTLQALGIIR
jgi:hypothetical protein